MFRLRERAGDFTRSLMAESAGYDGDTGWIEDRPDARCSAVSCRFEVTRGGRHWRVLAFRSAYFPDWADTVAACAMADIVIAERRLPRACRPRWLKLDGPALRETGGLALTLGQDPNIASVADRLGDHPWAAFAPTIRPPR